MQHACRGTGRKDLQSSADPHWCLVNRRVERDGDVVRRGSRKQPLVAVHCTLANFRQAPVLTQKGKRARDKVGGQAVQREPDAAAVEKLRGANCKSAAVARAECAAYQPHTVQVEVLVRLADGGHGLRAQPVHIFAGG
eukprot:scaffold36275_cov154-Isochrysis_galbana.AAC.22